MNFGYQLSQDVNVHNVTWFFLKYVIKLFSLQNYDSQLEVKKMKNSKENYE